MGAWIETYKSFNPSKLTIVAPFMGAWIETLNVIGKTADAISRTLHGCVD